MGVQQVVTKAQGLCGGRLLQPAPPRHGIDHLRIVLPQRPPKAAKVRHEPPARHRAVCVAPRHLHRILYQVVPVPTLIRWRHPFRRKVQGIVVEHERVRI